MCLKSKTSYGCGHCIKITDPCGQSDCTTMDRWSFPKYTDCAQCKASPEALHRGKEGRGRHGRQNSSQESRQSSSDSLFSPASASASASASYPSLGTPRLSISPWAPACDPQSKEKKWDTPTRQKADAAWLVEHERRMSDLEEKTSEMSIRANHESRNSSPRGSYERIVEADEVEEPEEIEPFPRSKPKAIKMLPHEISLESDHSHSHRRGRKSSRGSEYAIYQEQEVVLRTPHRKTRLQLPPTVDYDPQEYLQHQPIRKSRHSKTETYAPQSCFFDSPITGSPIAGAEWTDQYEVVHHSPHDPYYPRTYQVVY